MKNLTELGPHIQEIIKRLLLNDNFVKLLYYTDKNPLSNPALTNEQKQKDIYNSLLRIIPKISAKETAQSIVSIQVEKGSLNSENNQYRDFLITFEIFVPFTQWIINDINLRPFAILGEIQKSLNKKRISGLGTISGGDFEVNYLTEELSCHKQYFQITLND